MTRFPPLFLSHGAPLLALENSPAGRFLDTLGTRFGRPRAIVVASAHYTDSGAAVGAAARPATVHDFGDFGEALFALRYPAPGEPALAQAIGSAWQRAGIDARIDAARGLDHGVWVPLHRMYPDADIPVVPLAVASRRDARWHYALGRALRPLRDDGVLVVGSGGFVHNLGDLAWSDPNADVPAWAAEFSAWMHARLAAGEIDALLDWADRAPSAARAHPTPEHLWPLFVALGAASTEPRVEVLHRSHQFGSLALDAFAFH